MQAIYLQTRKMEDFDELLRIQRQMAGRIVQESNTDKKLQLLDIISDFCGVKNKKVQTEQVLIEATSLGWSEAEVLRLIDELVDLGYLKIPEEGFVQKS